MTIGTSEFIAIVALLVGFVAWVNNSFTDIDKRFDNIAKDMNGIGNRVAIFEEGTCELLGEQINQLKSKIFELEDTIARRRDAPHG